MKDKDKKSLLAIIASLEELDTAIYGTAEEGPINAAKRVLLYTLQQAIGPAKW